MYRCTQTLIAMSAVQTGMLFNSVNCEMVHLETYCIMGSLMIDGMFLYTVSYEICLIGKLEFDIQEWKHYAVNKYPYLDKPKNMDLFQLSLLKWYLC